MADNGPILVNTVGPSSRSLRSPHPALHRPEPSCSGLALRS